MTLDLQPNFMSTYRGLTPVLHDGVIDTRLDAQRMPLKSGVYLRHTFSFIEGSFAALLISRPAECTMRCLE